MQRPPPPAPPRSRPLSERLLPFAYLGALAFAAAGVGFAAYVYAVPYQRLVTQLKRRSGDLVAARTAAEASRKELDRLKHDLAEVRGVRNQRLGEEGRRRSDLKVLKAQVEERLGVTGVTATLDGPRLLLRFPEDAVFDARGVTFTKVGQEALEAVAALVKDRSGRVLVSAPMNGHPAPRWLRAQFPTAADFSAARAGGAVKVLVRAGLSPEATLAVVAGGPRSGAPETEGPRPTLDVEIDSPG